MIKQATKPELNKLINGITALPTLPQVVTRVNMLLSDPNVSVSGIANLILEDQALTLKFLKIVNSAFYGFPKKITQIDHAISILGFNTARSLLYTTSVINIFGGNKKISRFDVSQLWIHSLGVATACRLLASRLGLQAQAEDLYIAGLLHDVGKIAMLQYAQQDYEKALSKVDTGQMRLHDAEHEIFGYSHEEVGGLLAARWDLPQKLVVPIANHHKPIARASSSPYLKVTAAVHIADVICKMIDFGNSGDPLISEPDEAAWELTHTNYNTLNAVIEELIPYKPKIEDLFSGIS